jgi:hypothetical protein
MRKENVYIVVSHKHVLKTPGTKHKEPVWEVAESIEFVSQLRTKHLTMSSAIGDYINRKMQKGERHGMGDYDTFENYVRSKYEKEMAELDKAYRAEQVVFDLTPPEQEVFSDEFGNIRARTVFDKAEV